MHMLLKLLFTSRGYVIAWHFSPFFGSMYLLDLQKCIEFRAKNPGVSSSMLGIICLPGWNRVNWSDKKLLWLCIKNSGFGGKNCLCFNVWPKVWNIWGPWWIIYLPFTEFPQCNGFSWFCTQTKSIRWNFGKCYAWFLKKKLISCSWHQTTKTTNLVFLRFFLISSSWKRKQSFNWS